MKKMAIYEPALCCETGLCGVNPDPELLRITTLLRKLKEKNIIVDRFNLNNAPIEFVKNNKVNQYVNENGAEGLPCVTLDGNIIIEGRYPSDKEVLELLELPAQTLIQEQNIKCCAKAEPQSCCSPVVKKSTSGCCCGGKC